MWHKTDHKVIYSLVTMNMHFKPKTESEVDESLDCLGGDSDRSRQCKYVTILYSYYKKSDSRIPCKNADALLPYSWNYRTMFVLISPPCIMQLLRLLIYKLATKTGVSRCVSCAGDDDSAAALCPARWQVGPLLAGDRPEAGGQQWSSSVLRAAQSPGIILDNGRH